MEPRPSSQSGNGNGQQKKKKKKKNKKRSKGGQSTQGVGGPSPMPSLPSSALVQNSATLPASSPKDSLVLPKDPRNPKPTQRGRQKPSQPSTQPPTKPSSSRNHPPLESVGKKDRPPTHQVKGDSVLQNDDANLMSKLIHSLSSGTYECMVCIACISSRAPIWSCQTCFACFHLKCAEQWFRSLSTASSNAEYRCPGCQTAVALPFWKMSSSSCFCGKMENPPFVSYLNAHACGDVCLKTRTHCDHPCTAPCHPGPCPPCPAMTKPFPCFCGNTWSIVKCSQLPDIPTLSIKRLDDEGGALSISHSCNSECGNPLSCEKHFCPRICHDGPCGECAVTHKVQCACGKTTFEQICGQDTVPVPSCDKPCGLVYSCGLHKCSSLCHPLQSHVDTGKPNYCPTDPHIITTCHCGRRLLSDLPGSPIRKSCSSPIPSCGEMCGADRPNCAHKCELPCHPGPCPPCGIVCKRKCRCGRSTMEGPCCELGDICIRVCKVKLSCKRHLCQEPCCDKQLHICTGKCGKLLTCGTHHCLQDCGHDGNCHSCVVGVSFDELHCNCGQSVIYPPIPCGVHYPKCPYTCVRSRSCGHSQDQQYAAHLCHADDVSCPPCSVLCQKPCNCGKSMQKMACHLMNSQPSHCGQVCAKAIPRCLHPCHRYCHQGPCLEPGVSCSSKCLRVRPLCGHICRYPCHASPECPESQPCRESVMRKCACGTLSQKVVCGALRNPLDPHASQKVAPSFLPCDNSCRRLERNQRLMNALKITAPAQSSIAVFNNLKYPEVLIQWFLAHPSSLAFSEQVIEEFIKTGAASRTISRGTRNDCISIAQHLIPHVYTGLKAEMLDLNRPGKESVRIWRGSVDGQVISPFPLLSLYLKQWREVCGSIKQQAMRKPTSSSLLAQQPSDGTWTSIENAWKGQESPKSSQPMNALCLTFSIEGSNDLSITDEHQNRVESLIADRVKCWNAIEPGMSEWVSVVAQLEDQTNIATIGDPVPSLSFICAIHDADLPGHDEMGEDTIVPTAASFARLQTVLEAGDWHPFTLVRVERCFMSSAVSILVYPSTSSPMTKTLSAKRAESSRSLQRRPPPANRFELLSKLNS